MGRLIKNHWARLVILTASVCMFLRQHPHFSQSAWQRQQSNNKSRPNKQRDSSLYLAQDLLGSMDQKPRRRREASTHSTNLESISGSPRGRMGMAIKISCRLDGASQHRIPIIALPAQLDYGCPYLPGYQCCNLLSCWDSSLFLGL